MREQEHQQELLLWDLALSSNGMREKLSCLIANNRKLSVSILTGSYYSRLVITQKLS